MKPEEEKVKESFKNFLKNNLDAVHVIYHSKKLPIKVFKLESEIILTELERVQTECENVFKYSVEGMANIGISDDEILITKPMNFSLTVIVKEDSVEKIECNLICISDL